jgi:putative addiction module component (TIGR02574 family)
MVMDKALLDQVMQLDPADRIELAQRLLESVADEADDSFELTDEQKAEIERRMGEHERDPSTAIPLNEFMARLRSRFG